METETTSLKKIARIAGLWYLALIVAGIYGLRFVQSQIVIKGNGAATAINMLTHEFLFRTGIVSSIVGNLIFLFLVLALYRLFNQVNHRIAQLMVVLVLVQIPISIVVELFNFISLMILKGEVLKSLSATQKQDFVQLFLRVHSYGLDILETFWGIWLIPFGQLVYRSGFIPCAIGVLLIAGGVAYMADSFTYLLFPHIDQFIGKLVYIASVGEIIITLWLLIVGAREPKFQIVESL